MTAAELLDLALKGGPLWIAIFATGVLAWALLIPRKGKDVQGRDIKRSPLIVPGTAHDREVESCGNLLKDTRKFYEDQLTQLRKQADLRVGEIRGYRDEALATNAQLLEMMTGAVRDSALALQTLQILRDDLANRNGSQSEASRASAKD